MEIVIAVWMGICLGVAIVVMALYPDFNDDKWNDDKWIETNNRVTFFINLMLAWVSAMVMSFYLVPILVIESIKFGLRTIGSKSTGR